LPGRLGGQWQEAREKRMERNRRAMCFRCARRRQEGLAACGRIFIGFPGSRVEVGNAPAISRRVTT